GKGQGSAPPSAPRGSRRSTTPYPTNGTGQDFAVFACPEAMAQDYHQRTHARASLETALYPGMVSSYETFYPRSHIVHRAKSRAALAGRGEIAVQCWLVSIRTDSK